MRLLLPLLFLPAYLYGACTGSSPTWSSTIDRTSVATCAASASSGDTINVAAGTATWSSEISIDSGKDLKFIGAGVDVSTINGSAGNLAFDFVKAVSGSRISGFTFGCLYVMLDGVGWRVDHNKFTCATSTAEGVFMRGKEKTAMPKGLIDHNEFFNQRVLAVDAAFGTPAEYAGTNHHTFFSIGDDQAMYVEDNTFEFDEFFNTIDCNWSGQYVFRFNTVTGAHLEAHGTQGYNRSCKKWEIYKNQQNRGTAPSFTQMALRGGSGMVWGNTTTGSWNQSNVTLDYARDANESETGVCPYTSGDEAHVGCCTGSSGWDTNTVPGPRATNPNAGYPCRDQIGRPLDNASWVSGNTPPSQSNNLVPAYMWLNTNSGSNLEVLVQSQNANDRSDDHIVENVDFYDYTASFNGTAGVGSGVIASRPATCTTGVGYWATDEGEWNSLQSGADGRFYKCTSTNTWTLYYTPYTYPHPLQGTVSASPAKSGGGARHGGGAKIGDE